MRRMHIDGDLKLMEVGWASGGFLAQCHVEGKVLAGSQQQYFARNCSWSEWTGGAWSLLLTPGQNALEKPIIISRPGTIVFGLGLPTLRPTAGNPCVQVDAGEGVILSGLMLDAGEPVSETLIRVGTPGRRAGSAGNPTSLRDVFIRVGGPGPGGIRTMVEIHDDHVLCDNLWLWRADHGKGVSWTSNPNETGLVVTGAQVTCYGLAVEHTQGRQVVWSGEDGQVFFFQSEMPYDPPSQDQWMDGTSRGFSAYWIDPKLRRHQAVGKGVYHVFKKAPVIADRAIEAPEGTGIRLRRMFTARLAGGQPGSDIAHILNQQTGQVHPSFGIIRTLDSH